jgi:glycosyltransferase involved in cell wall biosynthesis
MEGIPTVLMEAQAIGLPCVSTHHSGIPEVIPPANHGFLADEGDVDGISERIARLLSCSEDQLAETTRAGRSRVEEAFNLKVETEKLKIIYLSISKI